MLWLTNPSIAPVLAGLAVGRIQLTHQALDGLPQTRALAHLRQTLVAVGALPGRDEEMTRLEAFLAGLIDSQPGTERRQLLHPLPDLAPGQAAAQPQPGPARHLAAVPHDPPAGPRRRRVP